jgi:hypothetical protein
LIACYVPSGEFCCESISYFPEKESAYPLGVLLALLNSKLLEWYFRIGSTNAMVNEYQINNLPAPEIAIALSAKREISELDGFAKMIERKKWDESFMTLESHLTSAPFPSCVMTCLIRLVDEIAKIEKARGEIARSDRSALAPEAQPYQDLIDRIIYRMAGLTDAEARGLELRLAEML